MATNGDSAGSGKDGCVDAHTSMAADLFLAVIVLVVQSAQLIDLPLVEIEQAVCLLVLGGLAFAFRDRCRLRRRSHTATSHRHGEALRRPCDP